MYLGVVQIIDPLSSISSIYVVQGESVVLRPLFKATRRPPKYHRDNQRQLCLIKFTDRKIVQRLPMLEEYFSVVVVLFDINLKINKLVRVRIFPDGKQGKRGSKAAIVL